jgi:hypothetical protein
MKTPDPSTAIPAPTVEDKPFEVGDELTVYEAAMVYAGRHPYPEMFGPYGGKNRRKHCLTLLKLGLSERLPRRQRAQRSWNIFCEVGERIRQGKIKPITTAYDLAGEIDLIDTVISTAEIMQLARDRDEQPKYLRPLLVSAGKKTRSAKPDANYEQQATSYLIGKLELNRGMRRKDAWQACLEKFPKLTSDRAFVRRVWKNAKDAIQKKAADDLRSYVKKT